MKAYDLHLDYTQIGLKLATTSPPPNRGQIIVDGTNRDLLAGSGAADTDTLKSDHRTARTGPSSPRGDNLCRLIRLAHRRRAAKQSIAALSRAAS
jgi:hypothetical protein